MTKILMTGGTGFLGRAIVERLVAQKHEVHVITRNNELISQPGRLTYLSTENVTQKLLTGDMKTEYDIIFHGATEYDRFDQDLAKSSYVNFFLPYILYHLVPLSQSAFYFNIDSYYTSGQNPTSMINYVGTKKLIKQTLMEHSKSNCNVVNLRVFHLFGPNDREDKFTEILRRQIATNNNSYAINDPDHEIDFIYLDRAVELIQKLINNRSKIKEKYSEFDIGSGQTQTILEFANMMKSKMNSNILFKTPVPQNTSQRREKQVANLTPINLLGIEETCDLDVDLSAWLKNYD
jgi:nucleoside-diphosphate-sugar epimerase